MKKKISHESNSITLTPTIFHILVVLSSGERHGYAILREVEEIAEDNLRLGPTTLYRSIRTMLEGGLIEESDKRRETETDDERRRYYRLTGFGARVLNEEVQRLENLINIARKKSVLKANELQFYENNV